MNDYLAGAISHLMECDQQLIALIPNGLQREELPLERTCRGKPADKLDGIRELITEETWPDFASDARATERRQFPAAPAGRLHCPPNRRANLALIVLFGFTIALLARLDGCSKLSLLTVD